MAAAWVWSVLSRFGAGWPSERKKGRQSDGKQRVFFGGRKRACLAGKVWQRFWWEIWGVHTGITAAPIFDWMQRRPAHDTFPFRDEGVVQPDQPVASDSVSRRHSQQSRVTGHFSWDGHNCQPLVAFPAPCCQARPTSCWCGLCRAGGDLQTRGPTLIIVGKGQVTAKAPDYRKDMIRRLLPAYLACDILSALYTYHGTHVVAI